MKSIEGGRKSVWIRRYVPAKALIVVIITTLTVPYFVFYGKPRGPGYPTELYGYRIVLEDPALAVVDVEPRRTLLFRHTLTVSDEGWSVHPVFDIPPLIFVRAERMDTLETVKRNLWAVVLQEGAGRVFMPDEFVEGGVPGLITGIAGQAWAWKHLKWAREFGVIHGLRRYAKEVGPERISTAILEEYRRAPWRAILDFCDMMKNSDVGRFLRSRGLSFRDFLTSKDPKLVAEVLVVLDLGRLDERVVDERIRYVLDARAYPIPESEEKIVDKAARELLRHG
ncbi:hypothetical protein [Methanopyrus kandleri]|uniref:Uncharacterized protein n=1 Tax=Methanopyrus kandleri TaxID=2320 RepID=A0A832T1D5_9EURY|nr:hypothetical protein [Methanopyrus kandleri]HII69915.1 hypothetical protein [Methanopyrus kandleri]